MPITMYNLPNLKKLLKKDLYFHVLDLYDFINLFDNIKTQKENEKLNNKNLIFIKEIQKLKKEIEELKKD